MSIADIAKITGVSEATVSRVLNNKPGPSTETAQVVSLAAREMGYLQKRNIKRKKTAAANSGIRSDMFSFLALGLSGSCTGNSVLLTAIRSIEETLSREHFNLNLNFVTDEKHIPKMILNGVVDGVFLYGHLNLSDSTIAKLKKVPSIWLMYNFGGWGDHFSPDNFAIGRKAAEYVIESGYKKSAVLLAGKATAITPFGERSQGFKGYMEASGYDVKMFCSDKDTALLEIDPKTYPRIISEEIGKLLDDMFANDDHPEVIFVPNDSEVAVLYQHLAMRDIKVGSDIVVVTCDGHNLPLLYPMPVVVDIRSDLVGKYAAEHMLVKLSDNSDNEDMGDVKMLIQPELDREE